MVNDRVTGELKTERIHYQEKPSISVVPLSVEQHAGKYIYFLSSSKYLKSKYYKELSGFFPLILFPATHLTGSETINKVKFSISQEILQKKQIQH